MDNPAFREEPFCERMAWLWLIQEASFEPHKIRYKNKMIEVGIGQVPISYRRLVDKWKWGIHRIRNFLDLLESEQMITRQTATGFLIITVCNYQKYQKPSKISTTPTATLTATLTTTPTATNINNTKELKEENIKAGSEEFWNAYPVNNRNKGDKKKAMAAYAVALKKTNHETIMKGIAAYGAYLQASGQSNADACRWLSNERWAEDYSFKPVSAITSARYSETKKGVITL